MSAPAYKFTPPNLPTHLIQRTRLETGLSKGLEEKVRLFLVSAPTGYGKSTLIAKWIQEKRIQHIWINLDGSDDNPSQLVSLLQQGLSFMLPGHSKNNQKKQTVDVESSINHMIEQINQINKTCLIIFDRFEVLNNKKAQELVFKLAGLLPMQAACVIISRKNATQPISRLRAHNQLVEISERDLRFNLKEIQQFIQTTTGIDLDPDNLENLNRKTAGWAAGLRLAVDLLGDQLGTPSNLALSGLNGSHRYFTDYFNEEVFQKTDPSLHAFMIQCSVFDQFSTPLCRAVLDCKKADRLIQSLMENKLFVSAVEGSQGWFKFHPLFNDFLNAKCTPEEKRNIYRRSADWFRQQGQMDVAVDYGLKSGDEQTALGIIEPACEKVILDGNWNTITNWFEKWRQNGFRQRAELLVYEGWIKALQGDFVQAQVLIERAGDMLKSQPKEKNKENNQTIQITQGKMAALQAFIDVMYSHQYNNAMKQARQALKLLPKNRSAWNLMALWAQAETQKRVDHIGKSIDTLYEALRMGKSIGGKIFYYAVVNSLAAALHFNGRRSEALELCRKTIDQNPDADDPALGGIYAWMGRLNFEANQIDKAMEYIQTGIHLSEKFNATLNLIFAYYYASQIYQAIGQHEKAGDLIKHAELMAGNASLSDECWLNAWEANLNLMQDNHIQVEHWIRREGPKLDQRIDYLNMEMMIVYARYLIRKNDVNNAAKRLQNMEKAASKRGYYRWLLTIYILQAILWEKKKKKPQALECLKRALHIAAPEEYQRAFLDEDPLILRLVQELSSESPAFIMRLLRSATSQDKDKKQIPASILPEPLSEREMQVLELLASGKKGPQIADELFISYSTVRTHLKSIHRKLDVHTRQELLEKIRLLELV